jgi:hypothetical protein
VIDCSVSRARAELQRRLETELAALPAPQRRALEGLAPRLGPQFEAGDGWTGRLSPLTLLYPWLQAEPLARSTLTRALPYCAAHTLLVLHGFIDDRQIDGQARLSATEAAAGLALRERGLSQLQRLSRRRAWLDGEVAAATAHYHRSVRATYRDGGAEQSADAESHRIAVAAGLVAVGRLAPLALAGDLGADSVALRDIRQAYDLLAYGLQWGDDFEDVDEDLERGEQNLLLDALRRRSGVDPALSADRDRARADLVDHGILEHALETSGDILRRVAAMQRRLGCATLAALIEEKLERLSRFGAALATARRVTGYPFTGRSSPR